MNLNVLDVQIYPRGTAQELIEIKTPWKVMFRLWRGDRSSLGHCTLICARIHPPFCTQTNCVQTHIRNKSSCTVRTNWEINTLLHRNILCSFLINKSDHTLKSSLCSVQLYKSDLVCEAFIKYLVFVVVFVESFQMQPIKSQHWQFIKPLLAKLLICFSSRDSKQAHTQLLILTRLVWTINTNVRHEVTVGPYKRC